jgi:hypothetical protein
MAKLTATYDEVADWMVTAFEGGINYWCGEAKYDEVLRERLKDDGVAGCPMYSLGEYWKRGGSMMLQSDIEDSRAPFLEVNYDIIINALSLDCVSNSVAMRLLTGEYDADDADIIVQAALFGEIVYG